MLISGNKYELDAYQGAYSIRRKADNARGVFYYRGTAYQQVEKLEATGSAKQIDAFCARRDKHLRSE